MARSIPATCSNATKNMGERMHEKLSITIVAYRNYSEVEDAVRSIEQYTESSIEKRTYIVDNSGKDSIHLKECIDFQHWLSQYHDVTYLNPEENLGFGQGHNYILNKLDSKFHAIVNPDILLRDDAFASLLEYMEQHPDVGMCIPNMIDVEGKRQKAYRRELTVFDMFIRMFCPWLFPKRMAWHTMQDMDYSVPFRVPFGQGSFLVIRTDLFKELKGFDDRYFMYLEDADLCKRVNTCSKLMYCPSATVIHKWRKGSHKNLALFKYHIDSMRRYFKKWGYRWF